MTGPEHWSEADLILTGKRCEYGCPHSGCEHEMSLIARAQVHATLALAAATAAGSRMCPEDRRAWDYGAAATSSGPYDHEPADQP